MAASTITLKFSPSEYETVKTELAAQQESLNTDSNQAECPPGIRHALRQRVVKLDKILREI
jgi:hypothetical protein